MEPSVKVKKLYLDENFNPIIQKNKDGVIIFYSKEGQESIKMTYHYFMR